MTRKRTNGADPAAEAISAMFNPMQAPPAFAVSQRLAMESARFWARRMHAYANQMEALAGCTSVDQLAEAQSRFIDRMREDYAAETKALSAILAMPSTEPEQHIAGAAGAD